MHIKAEYVIGLVILVALTAGALLALRAPAQKVNSTATSTASLTATEKARQFQEAPEITGASGYINTGGQPITIAQFKGKKVILVDFWTYSCINCQRTLPYLKQWYEKYADWGLEIIGIHTPEFAFEHDYGNVARAVAGFGLKYPVVLDNNYATWNAFGNQYWPRKYLIDIDGYIVYDHAGEGNYDITETAIQRALAERALRLGLSFATGTEAAPAGAVAIDPSQVQSPETYFGAARNEYVGNGTRGTVGTQKLTLPSSFAPNTLYLGGTWDFQSEYASNKTATAQIRFLYNAKNVYFVASASTPVKIKVAEDGRPLGANRGADVNADGEATIQEDRLYKLIEGAAHGQHTIEIEIEGASLKAYTFTFG